MTPADGVGRRGWPTGSGVLIIGLGVQAASTYAFLVLAGRVLGPVGFGALSGLYVLLTSLATGLFQPLEQEVTRRRGVEHVRMTHDPTLHRRALGIGLLSALAVVAVALAGWPISSRLLGEEAPLVVALCVGVPGYAVWFAVRGELAGRRELTWYAGQLVVEGMFRLLAAVALVLAGADGLTWFGVLFALSPWVAAATGTVGRRHTPQEGTPSERTPALAGPVYLLVASALATQLIVNAGPLIVMLLATDAERDRAGIFLAVLVVLRVPIFLFTAVQPPLLTALSGFAATGQRSQFVSLVRRALLAVVVVGVAATAVGTAVAPWVVSFAFDFEDELGRTTFFVLTASVGLLLVGLVVAQSLLALARHRQVMAGWLSGLLGLSGGAALGGQVVDRAAHGLLLGSLTALVALGLLLGRALRDWRVSGQVPGVLSVPIGPSAEP